MREILFRGKRVDTGEWAYGDLVHIENKSYISYYYESELSTFINDTIEYDGISIVGVAPFVEVDPFTVGQYTGLNDKNGNKIFEGDILKIFEGSEDNGYKICNVYSYKGVLCVDYETSEWDFNALAFLDSDNVFTFEVIGNIYDNPVLLEVG